MNDVELMLVQAGMTKALAPERRVFIYANFVKALPWLSYVREKLVDPAYSGWFLHFAPGGAFPNGSWHVPSCDTGYSPPLCSNLYHDQLQTPQVPSPGNPNPDGNCVGTCDCGGVPCGEYLWDHRNASMREWLVSTLTGPYGTGSGVVDGFFLDDFFCSNIVNGSGACTDPVQGATEVDAHQQADMGLSDADIADLTRGWLATMTAAQQALLDAGAYTWSLMRGGENADATPRMVERDSCVAELRAACAPSSPWATEPLLFGLHAGNATVPLPQLQQDIAAYLLMRGPWAFVGYGVWGMSWPVGTSWVTPNGTSAPVPQEFSMDYGRPAGLCVETAAGVFQRLLSKSIVQLDCNAWQANITML